MIDQESERFGRDGDEGIQVEDDPVIRPPTRRATGPNLLKVNSST